MSEGVSPDWLSRLEAAVEGDPGSPGFPALGEAYRRAGRVADAERVLREGLERKPSSLEGQLVLSLVLMDQGRAGAARDALLSVAGEVLAAESQAGPASDSRGPATPPAPATSPGFAADQISEAELEDAFEGAETDRDAVVDADRVAQDAMREADLSLPEELATPSSSFATRTVADLLERQGDEEGAAQVRATLESGAEGAAPAAEAEPAVPGASAAPSDPAEPRERVVSILERWLSNLRRERK